MIVTIGTSLTAIAQVQPGDIVFNTGSVTVYVDTIQANVITAPQSSATPVLSGQSIQWAGQPGLLYGISPSGTGPGVGVTAQTGLPFPAPVARLTFSEANEPFSGLFGYSPMPGPGNLQYSVAITNGLDPFGNAYLAGQTQYIFLSGTYYAFQNFQSNIQLLSAPSFGGPYTALDLEVNFFTNYIQITANGPNIYATGNQVLVQGSATPFSETSEVLEVHGGVAVIGSVVAIVSGATEAPHTITPNAGFTAGGTTPTYEYLPIGAAGSVRLNGSINLTAAEAAGTTVFTLPPGYRPSQDRFFQGYNDSPNYLVTSNLIGVTTGGAVQIGVAFNNGDFFVMDNMVIAL